MGPSRTQSKKPTPKRLARTAEIALVHSCPELNSFRRLARGSGTTTCSPPPEGREQPVELNRFACPAFGVDIVSVTTESESPLPPHRPVARAGSRPALGVARQPEQLRRHAPLKLIV